MKKIFLFLFFLTLIVLFIYFFARDKVGDIRPAIFPSEKSLPAAIREAQKTGEQPDIPLVLPAGFSIGVFAEELNGARDLAISPGGTILLSLQSEGRVVALPDEDNNGEADENITAISGLIRPHGLAFFKGILFIAEETKVSRYTFDESTGKATLDKKLFDLPTGDRHKTRSIVFDKNGTMYVSLGSTCDTCIEKHPFIGKVIKSDSEGRSPQVFSEGLRNVVFLAVHPETGEVWTTEMGRDFLGDETPPDEINILKQSGNYGWPFCYGDKEWDKAFGQQSQSYCNNTIAPFYKIPAHSAPLGLTFINSDQYPEEWQNDLLVAYHGSWNRSTPAGYKIVRVSTKGDIQEYDFITGFISDGDALGRPVDILFDEAGSLFISDDKADAVYKMVKK